jgi:hypothetical protein
LIIYIENVDKAPKVQTGDYLGDITDELVEFGSGFYIEEFVTGGPKNYEFLVFCRATMKRDLSVK